MDAGPAGPGAADVASLVSIAGENAGGVECDFQCLSAHVVAVSRASQGLGALEVA